MPCQVKGWPHPGTFLRGAQRGSASPEKNGGTVLSQHGWKGLVKAAASRGDLRAPLSAASLPGARFLRASAGSLSEHLIVKLEKKIGMFWLIQVFTYRSHFCSVSRALPLPLWQLLEALSPYCWGSFAMFRCGSVYPNEIVTAE